MEIKSWWTGAAHLLAWIAQVYTSIARAITGLPKWTPRRFLLAEAGLPPLDPHLDTASQSYTIRSLFPPDDCHYKTILASLKEANLANLHGVGLRRLAKLLRNLIPRGETLEDPSTTVDPVTKPPTIPQRDQKTKAASQKGWAATWGCIRLYTDRSKRVDGTTASAWHCVRGSKHTVLFEGFCCLGR